MGLWGVKLGEVFGRVAEISWGIHQMIRGFMGKDQKGRSFTQNLGI
jgi:hypothetical protein